MAQMATPRTNDRGALSKLISCSLPTLDSKIPHTFIKPAKKINEGRDVEHFLTSRAYSDIGLFVMQLNLAMCPRKDTQTDLVETYRLDSHIDLPESVLRINRLLSKIEGIIDEAPPDTGPRRFGNVSFRRWFEMVDARTSELLQAHLPVEVIKYPTSSVDGESALDELGPYFLGAFGSPQRLDYGTGHELSFLAFIGCIWKLGGFTKDYKSGGNLERSIVVGIIEPYLKVIRRLILTYTLEPAGSHGVWGLDDHFFVSYILGSSQYCPAITEQESMPIEGSLPDTPNPADVAKKQAVDIHRLHNMYFSAIGFINDVKTGPFWEHSPMLFDISGVRSGWGKINKGMIKMYNAEVLSKFPVVQHFPFGSLFSWERDPNATARTPSVHARTHSSHKSNIPTSRTSRTTSDGLASTAAPWAQPSSNQHSLPGDVASTSAPWAHNPSSAQERILAPPDGPTRAPWMK